VHVDQGIPELLVQLGPQGRPLVEHLVRCETCRLRVLMVLEEEGLQEADERTEDESATAPRILLRMALLRAVEETTDEEARAGGEWGEVIELSAGDAWAAIVGGTVTPNAALAARLLPDELAAGENPDLTEKRAHLVLAIGARLERTEARSGDAAECGGRAWSALGEVARLRGDRGSAEMAFGMAAAALDPTEWVTGERALFCRLLARLRMDQGRLDEALALLERAAGLYLARRQHDELGETLAEKGRLLLEELEIDAAALALQAAVRLIDREKSLWAALRARQGLALCAAERGRESEAAREWWSEVEGSVAERPWSELDRHRLTLLYAEIAERAGHPDRAARLLEAAIAGLAERGEIYEAAVGMARLLGLLAGRGEARPPGHGGKGALVALREALAPLARDVKPWAVLLYLFDLAQTRRGTSEIFRVGAEYLDRARHNPTLAQHPRWRPRAIVSWDGLTEASRKDACRLALVDAGTAGSSARDVELGQRVRLAWVYEAYTEIRILFLDAAAGGGGQEGGG
jgi:tetratricopeptide (TPR) repeat protein